MKKRIMKFALAILVSTMCLSALAPQAKATGVSSGEFPVTIDLGDSLDYSDEEVEIELKSEHSDNPMPEGAKDGVYSIYIKGAKTSKFPKIDYPKVGTFTYTISQKIESEEVDDFDTNTYLLKVQVTRSETTDLLQAVSTMYVLGQDIKVAGAVFYNAPPPTPVGPTPAPTESPSQPPKPDQPKTSDDTNVWSYIVLFTSGAVMIVFLGFATTNKSRRITNK